MYSDLFFLPWLCHSLTFAPKEGIESYKSIPILFWCCSECKGSSDIQQDIEDKFFWKAIYCLLRAVFPALKALQDCNATCPAMDKIYTFKQNQWFNPQVSLGFWWCRLVWTNARIYNDQNWFGISEVHGDKIEFERYFYVLIVSFLSFLFWNDFVSAVVIQM